MIRCSHCGKLAPTGAVSCQHCGMPLASNGGEVTNAGQAGQQELPAWLESLRAHERPVPGGQEGRQPFSMDELVDENSMPSWMRQDRQRAPEGGNSDAFPALAETAQPGAGPEKQNFAPNGLEAGSLIDERSLPSWMRDNSGGGQPGAGQNLSAQSLVDQRALPSWIKELGQTAQPAANNYGLPAQPAQNQYGLPVQAPAAPSALSNTSPRVPQTPPGIYNEPSAAPTQGFSAHDLIDQQAMPAWMTGAQEPGSQAQNKPVPTEHGFSAGDLVDQRAVPAWMKDLQGPAKSDPISAMGVPVNGSGQMMGQGQQGIAGGEGMPASTLLDMNSMPSWMREGAPGGAGNAQAQGTPLPGEGMAAGSLIDMGSLPAWLRNADNTQQAAPSENSGSSARPAQARPEMRVPSRPRNEVVGQEQSEVAANVFASMLGVSASAPALPDQMAANNNLGVAQGQPVFPGQQVQQVIPGWQSPSQPPALNQGAQPQMWQASGSVPAYGSPPAQNAYAPVSQPGGMPPAQPPYTGLYPADNAALGSAAGMGNNGQREPQAVGAKKKGFFDSIRDFFSK